MVVVLVTVVVIYYWHVHYDYATVLEWYVYVDEFNWLLLLLVEMGDGIMSMIVIDYWWYMYVHDGVMVPE